MSNTATPIYTLQPAGLLDRSSRRITAQTGQPVQKVQPSGTPRNGVMGMCFVQHATTGEFIGQVCENSLQPTDRRRVPRDLAAETREQITTSGRRRTCPKPNAPTGREQVIDAARKLDPDYFDIETNSTRPWKYEGASDIPLAVALDLIHGHGFADESSEVRWSGYAWRVAHFVGIEDPQGFVTTEEHPSERDAIERMREFDSHEEDEAL